MSSNGFNLVSYEKFDEALNYVKNLSSCNISNAVNVLNNSGNLPSAYSEISNGIADIKSAISRLGNEAGPEKLIENYITGYNDIKNQIINAYIAEYEFSLKNGNIDEALKQFGKIDKNAFKTEISEMLKKMNDKNNADNTLLQYSCLAEFFKEIKNAFSKYSVKLDDASNGIANLLPKNNRDIAHRGYTPGGIRDNSAEGFILAGEKGFWGCEADVRFDADGNLVCSHNSVKKGDNPTTFEEYLDICKKYGMTAIIDLKYEKGPNNADEYLSTSILKTIKDKGMMNSCVLQTNNAIDIAYIRENSNNARIWYLTDSITDKNVELIQNNNVECVNILSSDKNANRIKKLTDNGIDVCVWNVQTDKSKDWVLNLGATYVMSDNVLGITPYKEGEPNLNDLKFDLNEQIDPILLKTNAGNFNDKNINASTTSNSSNTLNTGAQLTARKGHVDGPEAYETWYDLEMSQVVKNMSNLYGYTNVQASVREDGVKVLSGTAPDGTSFKNLVMVAADVRHDVANPNGTYERGQIVDTTLGKGIVVDACGLAIEKRKNNQGNHFDIATAWHTGEYMKQAYSKNETPTLSENVVNNLDNKVTGLPVNSRPLNSQSQGKNEFSNSKISVEPLSSNTKTVSKQTYSNTLNTGAQLTARKGHVDGPEAYETWYDLEMSQVVKNMSNLYGYTNVQASVREDGVKVLSGTAPDGTSFKNLVMVAADVRHDAANPNGTYERGQIVDTTLGKGIVVDACGLAIEKRKNNQGNHFDIATAWHTGEYMKQAYSKNETPTLSENVVNNLDNKVTGLPVNSRPSNSQSQEKNDFSNSEISVVPLSSNAKTVSEQTSSNTLNTGTQLTARKGHVDGPEAYETWYDLEMSQVVKNMSNLYGYTNVQASIREDGVKVLSGTAPDGTSFKNLVMVAADVRHDVANPNGTYERGQIVDTTLGKGIVVDACELAIEKRKNNQGNHFDIATAWHTGEYMKQSYSKNSNL